MNSVRLGEYVIPESIHGTQLARIVADKLPEIREAKRKLPAHSLRMAMERAPSVRSLKKVFSNRGPAIVAEIKRASPSAGVIREELDPVQIGRDYEESGASAISVLTEVIHFRGGLENLARLRWSTRLPLLRKDFIVDNYQLLESRTAGADAVLLITALLDQRRLRNLRESAESLGMEALIEVHDKDELSRALDAGATLIGVNSRDLRTFEVSLRVPLNLAGRIPSDCVAVAESGIRSARDIGELWDAGYRGFLIGELFMRAESPGGALANLKQAWSGGES